MPLYIRKSLSAAAVIVTPVMSSMLLMIGTASLTHAVPFHFRNCPEDGLATETLLKSSSVALSATVAEEPSPGVWVTVIPVLAVTSET